MRLPLLALALAAAVTGCAPAVMRSDDPRRAVALAPYQRPVQPFAAIAIREGEILYPSVVGGADAWCSASATYFAPGEARALCLFDPAGGRQPEGWFRTAYVVGTLASARLDVDVPYRVGERAPLPPRR